MVSTHIQEVVIEVRSLIRARRHYNKVFGGQANYASRCEGGIRYLLPESHIRITLKAIDSTHSARRLTIVEINVPDILYEYQRLQSLGVKIQGGIDVLPRGRYAIDVIDDDGNQVRLCAPETVMTIVQNDARWSTKILA